MSRVASPTWLTSNNENAPIAHVMPNTRAKADMIRLKTVIFSKNFITLYSEIQSTSRDLVEQPRLFFRIGAIFVGISKTSLPEKAS